MDVWDVIDAAVLACARTRPVSTRALAAAAGTTMDVMRQLTVGYLAAGLLTAPLPGCDRYILTLAGRTRLAHLTAADTRKAA